MAGQAVATYPVTSYNFGAFSEDAGPVECRFPIVNTGNAPLTVLSARATCGCTQPRYDREAVAPGDTTYITVAYDPEARPGRFNKQIYIETNSPQPKQKLDISGVVIGTSASVSRRYPVDMGAIHLAQRGMMLGEVTKGRLKTAYFEGYNRSDRQLPVKIAYKPSYVDIVAQPPVAQPGEQLTFVAYVNSAKAPTYGLIEDSVTIAAGDEVFTLPMTLIVNEDFSKLSAAKMRTSPIAVTASDRVDFGTIDRHGEPVTASFVLENGGKDPLEIRRIYSGDPGVSATIDAKSIKRGKGAKVTVTIDPAVQPGGLLNARLIIITNDPIHPTQTIRLVGQWK